MLLTIDIGNTNITLGVWDGRKWKTEWRLRTAHRRTSDEYGITLTNLLRESRLLRAINEVVIASVVPPLTTTFAELSVNYLKLTPTIIDHTSDTGITVATDNPSEVGTDRIINAAAAYHRFPGPSIVIDMGTATTFDIVSDRAELLGVAIAPGLRLAADALANQAAQLSQVPLQAPPSSIGSDRPARHQRSVVDRHQHHPRGAVGADFWLCEPDRRDGTTHLGRAPQQRPKNHHHRYRWPDRIDHPPHRHH